MKKIILFLSITVFTFADTLGGEVSMGLYSHAVDGTSRYKAKDSVDFKDTLEFSSTEDIFFKVYIEHPLPLVPNVKLAYHRLSYKGEALVSSVSWGELQNFSGTISSNSSLTYTDITLYYELLDNWIAVDSGVTFRSLKGDMAIGSRLSNDSLSYSESIAMLYAKARLYIPSTDISLQGEFNLTPLGSTSSYDIELSARYTFDLGIGVELGYKSLYLESDALASRLTTDFSISGPYAAVIWDF